MKYLLDANVLVHLANQVPGAERIQARLTTAPFGQLVLSAITACELRFMILRAKASRSNVAALERLVHQFPVEHFDLPAAHAAADVRYQLGDRPIGVYDMMLAGHARRLGYVIVSADADFDRVPGLKRENWLR